MLLFTTAFGPIFRVSEESSYDQSFVSAMVPKLEYDALLKARMAGCHYGDH